MPCSKGCGETISYDGKRKHVEECIHEPCCCPFLGCQFVASSEELSNHINREHVDSQIKFSYGRSFIVSLNSKDETILLQEEKYGKLFFLRNSIMHMGNSVSMCCIGPNSSIAEHGYSIMARSKKCNLYLHSFLKNVQQVTLATHSSEFLVIPSCCFGSSELVNLKIYINSKIQIFVRTHTRKMIPLKVDTSCTIANVKKEILEKEEIPVARQRLIFDARRLDDLRTIADCDIEENSILDLVLCICGC